MPTKTQTDPLADAESAVVAAAQVLENAKEHDRQLRQRLLDGEATVTAQELADSGHAIEHAKLGTEAAQLALAGIQKTARQERLAALADEITTKSGDPAEVSEAVKAIGEAVYVILTAEQNRYQNMGRWIAQMRREGIPEYSPNGKARTDGQGRAHTPYKVLSGDHAHLGWQPAGMGHGDVVYAAGRRIADISPGFLIRAGIERACRRAGGRLYATLGLENATHPALIEDPEGWLRERY